MKFEFTIIKKLDYDLSSVKGLEDFYEEVFDIYQIKFEGEKLKKEDEMTISG